MSDETGDAAPGPPTDPEAGRAATGPEAGRAATGPPAVAPPAVAVSSRAVVAGGTLLWALALLVVLVVPDLRTGPRSWWPWVPACGTALGLLGWGYLARGRGNAADAD